jgi:hypothetical protein
MAAPASDDQLKALVLPMRSGVPTELVNFLRSAHYEVVVPELMRSLADINRAYYQTPVDVVFAGLHHWCDVEKHEVYRILRSTPPVRRPYVVLYWDLAVLASTPAVHSFRTLGSRTLLEDYYEPNASYRFGGLVLKNVWEGQLWCIGEVPFHNLSTALLMRRHSTGMHTVITRKDQQPAISSASAAAPAPDSGLSPRAMVSNALESLKATRELIKTAMDKVPASVSHADRVSPVAPNVDNVTEEQVAAMLARVDETTVACQRAANNYTSARNTLEVFCKAALDELVVSEGWLRDFVEAIPETEKYRREFESASEEWSVRNTALMAGRRELRLREERERSTRSSTTPTPEPQPTEVQDESDDCVICADAKKTMVFVPCGHMCVCMGCADGLKQQHGIDNVLCPMCRAKSTIIIKMFK